MSEITTREYRYVNLFFACPVDPARAHVNMSAHVTRIAVNRSYQSYHLRDTSSKVSGVYLSREFAEKKFIWRTRPRPTGGGTRVLKLVNLDVPRAARGDRVGKVLEITGVDTLIDVFDSLESAQLGR